MGCFRSIEEIMQWSSAPLHLKKQILKHALSRKKAHEKNTH